MSTSHSSKVSDLTMVIPGGRCSFIYSINVSFERRIWGGFKAGMIRK